VLRDKEETDRMLKNMEVNGIKASEAKLINKAIKREY
jgi:hypothetical protein